jgi:hypothetical protein
MLLRIEPDPPARAASDGPVVVVDTERDIGGCGSSGDINSETGAGAGSGGVRSPSSCRSPCSLVTLSPVSMLLYELARRAASKDAPLEPPNAGAGLADDASGPPSQSAQNWIRSFGCPRRRASAGGSRIRGVERHISQCRSVRVQPLSIYSPS